MIDLELELVALEFQWREADDLVKAARAELAANANDPAEMIGALRIRVERAERKKASVMRKIIALEEHLDAAATG